MRKVVVDQSVDKNNTSQVLSVTNDLLQGMTGDYKECYLYTEKVVVRRTGGERFRYLTACGQKAPLLG